ncbi:vacuolar protein sorting-associated protein 45 homolog [Selaginella moellendorffii]|uniref:vacuolar protein sorting-associated protein 45 homolog n=1 Tax=Selaginella moellendorffii TaxID=88036 RepID=UPI000D1CA09C|nr:vacuolar protein sorting-associated protein 45 homolog [Selaginella moellendorffii]|eukprot:XP_024529786.1 vacuolar protein sorting-associated protein 45 homolog [Selaginella moellendorffii]
MVLVAAVRDYVSKMLSDIAGMKVFVLDAQTLAIVSVATSQSELLQKEVFLVEKAESTSSEPMTHLKAVCFLRPTAENMQNLKEILGQPRFGEYHLFFSNILKTNFVQNLADFDQHEAVQQVQEFYADFIALDPYHFTLNTPSNHLYMVPLLFDPTKIQPLCERIIEGVSSVFLALKKRPVIRYSRNSEIARRIAQDAARLMYEQEAALFDFRRTEVLPLLLIIDRRDDPVTPLLNQWTYQAMVHELIGIQDNKVDLREYSRVPKDQQEVVLSSEQDPFFRSNMFENFGDLGMNVKKMVDTFQSQHKSNQNIQSLEDMARFVENYPEFRKMQGNVSKHVALMTEMSRLVDERKLMSVSQAEQELACHSSQAAALDELNVQWELPGVTDDEKLRLAMLYALRYERENPQQLQELVDRLNAGRSKYNSNLLYSLLKQAGEEKRTGDLFSNRDLFNRARTMARGLKGVENVYTQHQPLVFHLIESIAKGRLKDADYPFVGNHAQQGKPQDVVIFIIGGTTYAESRVVALQNAANPGTRVLLGGTVVHNSKSFLRDLEEVQRVGRASIY